MRNTTRIISILILTTAALQVEAQIIATSVEGIEEMQRRPLIVELLEPDQGLIESYDKRIANAKSQVIVDKYTKIKEDYVQFAEKYNEYIPKAAGKYLKTHESISYKTTSEVAELRKSKSKEFSVLFYKPHTIMASNLHIKSVVYTRIENMIKKPDYFFYMPAIAYREQFEIREYGDYEIMFKLINNHFEGIKEVGKGNYPFSKHADTQAKRNCSEKTSFVLNVEASAIRKNETQQKMTAAYGRTVNLLPQSDMMTLIEEEKDELIALSIPLSIETGSGSAGAVRMNSSNIIYIRCFVNAKTGKIYASSGRKATPFYGSKEMKKLGGCK